MLTLAMVSLNMQRLNGIMSSIMSKLGKTGVPESDMIQKRSVPFNPSGWSLLIRKKLYSEKKEDLDSFLKAERLNKKDYYVDYWEIYDKRSA